MIRRLLVVLAILIGGAAAVLGTATPASAHASLDSTAPDIDQVVSDPPTEVALHFDEAVDATIGGVQVYGPDGHRVDADTVHSQDDGATVLAPVTVVTRGTYTVAWRVVSDDGHTISGSFVFHYLERSGSKGAIGGSGSVTSMIGWLARVATFAGAIVCIGSLLFTALTSSRDTRLATMSWWAAGVAQLGAFGVLWTRAAQVSGKSLPGAFAVLGQLVETNRSGLLDAVRVALVLVALVATMSASHRVRLLGVAPMAGALVTFSLSGHAWTASPAAFTVAVDVLHLLAVSIWVGGLAALAVVIRRVEDRDRIVRRFSTIATVGLVTAVVTGLVSTLVHVDAWSSLWSTSYGRLVSVKVIIVGAMALLGAMHRRIIVRQVERIGQWFASISLEALLGLAVVGVTAGLVFTIPAADARPRVYSSTAATAAGRIRLVVTPARVGVNDLRLSFLTSGGAARPVDATEVSVGTDTIPSRKLSVNLDDPSHVTVTGASFGTPGTWQVIVVTVTRGVSDTSTFEVAIP